MTNLYIHSLELGREYCLQISKFFAEICGVRDQLMATSCSGEEVPRAQTSNYVCCEARIWLLYVHQAHFVIYANIIANNYARVP